jgi:hypothetical protein
MAGTRPFQAKKGATGRRQVDSQDGWPNADNSAYVTPGGVALRGLGVPRVGRLSALGQVGRPADKVSRSFRCRPVGC